MNTYMRLLQRAAGIGRQSTVMAVLLACVVISAPVCAQTYLKTEVVTYEDNASVWVLGQTKRVIVNGIEVSETTYNAKAQPEKTSSFGKLQSTLTYNSDGTLSTFDDRSGVTTLSNWYRGVPKTIRFPVTDEAPGGATMSATVNPDGTIGSVIDENGALTSYEYDATTGRLTKVTYPAEDPLLVSAPWNPTTHNFSLQGAKYGLPQHWRWLSKTGNGWKITRYDALWRPVIEETYDSADPDNTRTLVVKRYDAAGRLAFQSYPLRSLPSDNYALVTAGTTTKYDALDRVTETSLPSADPGTNNGAFRTKIRYLDDFLQEVTSPNNAITTTSYLAWDEPVTDYPVAITHPEGAYTDITRDVFGKPTAITRRNSAGSLSLTRRFVYQPDTQELCKTIELESGATVMDYDAAGNLAWSAGGMNLLSASSCNLTDVPLAARTERSYDARNRLEALTFPDGNGDQDWEYRPNGLPSKVTTWNIGFPGATAKETVNFYVYNNRELLEAETLMVPAWYTFKVDHRYNANGHVVATTYPSSNTVDFAVNALGQVSSLSSGGVNYASGVTHYPNGAADHIEFGNGIVHTMDQNDRQLPRRSWTRKDGINYLDDVYAYDGNGNVEAITDNRPSAQGGGTRSRGMTYDGLDRLKSVASPMYGTVGANYTYNVLDDLTRVTIGGAAARDHYYCYDQYRQLTAIRNGPCTGGSGSTVHGLGYDVQGNLENKDGQHYRFDYGNRLREVIDVERYRYDAHGRRALAMQFATGTVLSMYGQDGRLMFQRSDRTGKQSDYLYLGGSLAAILDEPIGGGAETIKYQHTDALGSPVAVTAQDRTVLETTQYEPYGKVLNRPVHDGPGYTGHVEDAATGLVQMQQRYYDPGIGRFLSVDPVTVNTTTAANFCRYCYANNNPYTFTDPDGRQSFRMGPVNPDYVKGQAIAQGRTSEANAYASGKVVDAAPKSVIGEVGGSASGGAIVNSSAQGNAGVILPLTGDAAGAYATGGAMANVAGNSVSAPSGDPGQSQFSFGGAVEAGPSAGLTNATSASQLEGPATAYSLNTPAFTATATGSESGTWTMTVGTPAAGFSVTKQQVNTVELFKRDPEK